MAKFTVDTANKLFIAKVGVVTFDVRVDLYSDAKEHWIADNNANKFTFPFISSTTGRTTVQGGPEIDPIAGTVIPTYVFLENGWRIRPQELDHTLAVTGGVILVQGGGDPFVDTLADFTVRINYQQPVQAIGVSQGAVVAPTQQQIRDAMALATGASPAVGSVDGKLDVLDSSLQPSALQAAVWAAIRTDNDSPNTVGQALLEIFRIMGLDPSKPLVVTDNLRSAGVEIAQTYEDDGTKTTVTRT